MKITILVVGKTDKGFVSQAVEDYLGRLKRYISTEIVIIPDVKKRSSLSPAQLMEKEGQLIISALGKQVEIVLLDEQGKEFTSNQLSEFLQGKMLNGNKELVFVIGGAYGVDNLVKKKAKHTIALSRLTFSHQMARIILVEQIYRAMTILRGEPYHHQ